MAQAADLVGAAAAVRLRRGDRDLLAAVVEAAEQAGDPRAQRGIDDEAVAGGGAEASSTGSVRGAHAMLREERHRHPPATTP